MKLVPVKPFNHEMTVFRDLRSTTKVILNSRLNGLVKLAGYPVPSQLVALIHARIDLTTVKSMYESLAAIQKITYVASEILKFISLEKMERHQLSRKDIEATINTMAVTNNTLGVTVDAADAELIAYLLTSTDSDEYSWRLAMSKSKTDNLVFRLNALYRSLDNATATGNSANDLSSLVLWDTASAGSDNFGSVVFWKESSDYRALVAKADSADPNSKEARALAATAEMIKLSTIKVIDHVAALMFDTNIWSKFISPRTTSPGATVSQNLERGKSLAGLAMYCQSLLTYNVFFATEFQKQMYEKLAKWYIAFPELSSEVQINYQNIVRKNDLLNSYLDVEAIMATTETTDSKIGVKVHILFSDFIYSYGLDSIVATADTAAAKISPISSFSDLKELLESSNSALLLTHPVANANFMIALTDAVISTKMYSAVLQSMLPTVLAKLGLWYTPDNIARMKSLSLTLNLPWAINIPITKTIDTTTTADIVSGGVNLRLFAPKDSYEYTKFVQDNLSVAITAENDTRIKDFYPTYLVDRDEAAKLRTLIHVPARSLYPWSEGASTVRYKVNTLVRDLWAMKSMLEVILGVDYETFLLSLRSDFEARKYATQLSSFAFILRWNETTESYDRIDGYGQPYGVSWQSLYDMQSYNQTNGSGPSQMFRYIELKSDLNEAMDSSRPKERILFFNFLPEFTDTMELDTNVYLTHTRYYFKGQAPKIDLSSPRTVDNDSGSKKKKLEANVNNFGTSIETEGHPRQINKLIIEDSMLNYTRMIAPTAVNDTFQTNTLFSGLHAFINNRFYINMDINFSPRIENQTLYSLNVVKQEWTRPSYVPFLEYRLFMAYPSNAGGITAAVSDDEALIMSMKSEMEAKTVALNESLGGPAKPIKDVLTQSEDALVTDVKREITGGMGEASPSSGSSNKNKKKSKNKPSTKSFDKSSSSPGLIDEKEITEGDDKGDFKY